MFKQILTHESSNVNPFDSLTPSERDEYNGYLDDCKAQASDPLPSDFDSTYRALIRMYDTSVSFRESIDRLVEIEKAYTVDFTEVA